MSELGDQLRAARDQKELTVEQVAEATKIPLNYLYALEEDSFDVFTSDLHARGFLRNYASFLELDPEEAVSMLDQVRGALRVIGEDATPRQVVEHVYADVDEKLWDAAESSVRAQLAYLRAT